MKPDPHQILLAKAKHLTREQVESLSVRDAWDLVYSLPKERKPLDKATTVCFTGFSGPEETLLIEIANQNGFRVVQSVVKNLTILCCGPTPGPMKIEKAKAQGTRLISENDFRNEFEKFEQPAEGESSSRVDADLGTPQQ